MIVPPGERLREEIHGGAVLDLGAERGRAVDERDERQQRRHDEALEQGAGDPFLRERVARAEPVHEREADREEREHPEQHRPPAAEQLAQREGEDDADHRCTR